LLNVSNHGVGADFNAHFFELTLGASGDIVTGASLVEDKHQANPKFGIMWSPFRNTTFRAAAFRALKRTLINDQTLEPTQVAGFNQFYDDGNGTSAWRYGGAVDQKFSPRLFGGLEGSARDLRVPFLFANPPNPVEAREATWKEQEARAYLLWAPHEWFALRSEYFFDRFERDREFTFGIRHVNTHRFPLGVAFFHPSGVSAALTTTIVHQNGVFEPNPGQFRSGTETFPVVDAAISYRLPQRYGFVSFGAKNLFDEDFRYQDLDFNNPIFQPSRVLYVRVTLSLG